ncbi:MAG TPA: hypothetical protein VKR06_07495, partial [Ktedonosporobacter sp.]|nr:hypothetical protein [Ktedonosporobacter sp.]
MQQADRNENGREQAGIITEGAKQTAHAGRRRLLMALTILVFLVIGAVALYAISLIVGAVLLLLFSALLAYLIY